MSDDCEKRPHPRLAGYCDHGERLEDVCNGDVDWRARAEKAEAELAALQGVCSVKEHIASDLGRQCDKLDARVKELDADVRAMLASVEKDLSKDPPAVQRARKRISDFTGYVLPESSLHESRTPITRKRFACRAFSPPDEYANEKLCYVCGGTEADHESNDLDSRCSEESNDG